MYQRIMVPVDGSKLAECVLPHVETLAKGCGTQEVVLVSVTERVVAEGPIIRSVSRPTSLYAPAPVPEAEPITKVSIVIGKKQQQAQKYLHRIAKRLEAKGINVQTKVLLGNPADEIASYAENNDCDLIVMASHGRSGPSRWAYGSVADKVFRASCIPVLMVRAPGCLPGI